MTDRVCRTCRFATKDPGNESHYRVGLRNCALKPVWWFCKGNHSCDKWASKA